MSNVATVLAKQQSDKSIISNNTVKRFTSKKVLGPEPATLLKTCL